MLERDRAFFMEWRRLRQHTTLQGLVRPGREESRAAAGLRGLGVLTLITQFDPNRKPRTIQALALGSTQDRKLWPEGQDRLIAVLSPPLGPDSWSRYTLDALDNLMDPKKPGGSWNATCLEKRRWGSRSRGTIAAVSAGPRTGSPRTNQYTGRTGCQEPGARRAHAIV